MNAQIIVEPAWAKDAEAIADLLKPYAEQQIVLPRPVSEILEMLDHFLVARDENGRVLGAVAERDFQGGLHEVRSLVVHPDAANAGLGTRLVKCAVEAARQRGAKRVFALTLRPELFKRLGFREVGKGFEKVVMDLFPEKIWTDCAKCPKRDRCDEVAVLLEPLPPK